MKYAKLWLVALVVLTAIDGAWADQRFYVWTYQYQTMERGAAELESYTTFSSFESQNDENLTRTDLQYELEVGMTDRFDFSIYQVFYSDPGQDLKYKGFKLRSRYRFGEKGEYAVDPLIYLEYIGEPEFEEHAFELKLILAKDFGKFNLSLNPVLEIEKEGGEWEMEPEYALGASLELFPLLRGGLELKGSEAASYIGPTFSHGHEGLWVAFGSGFKISGKEEKADFLMRILLGISVGN